MAKVIPLTDAEFDRASKDILELIQTYGADEVLDVFSSVANSEGIKWSGPVQKAWFNLSDRLDRASYKFTKEIG